MPVSQHDATPSHAPDRGVHAAMHGATHNAVGGDCCDGGVCSADCGCAPIGLIADAVSIARAASSLLLTAADHRQPASSRTELLRPPIPA